MEYMIYKVTNSRNSTRKLTHKYIKKSEKLFVFSLTYYPVTLMFVVPCIIVITEE